jgi:hypothetical protein
MIYTEQFSHNSSLVLLFTAAADTAAYAMDAYAAVTQM